MSLSARFLIVVVETPTPDGRLPNRRLLYGPNATVVKALEQEMLRLRRRPGRRCLMGDPGWLNLSMSVNPGGEDDEPLDFDVLVYVKCDRDGELEAVLSDSERSMTVKWNDQPVPAELFLTLLGDEAKLHEAAYEDVMNACRMAQDVKPGWYLDTGTGDGGCPNSPRVCRVFGYMKHYDHSV
jgi:hypothetical protein